MFPGAQVVDNLPAVWDTWVRSLGWEDPLEKRKATHSSILTWRIPWTYVHGVTKSWTRLSDFHFNMIYPLSLPSPTFCSWEFYDYPYLTDFKTGALET